MINDSFDALFFDFITIEQKNLGIDINVKQSADFYNLIKNNKKITYLIFNSTLYSPLKNKINDLISILLPEETDLEFKYYKTLNSKKKYNSFIFGTALVWSLNETFNIAEGSYAQHESYAIVHKLIFFVNNFKNHRNIFLNKHFEQDKNIKETLSAAFKLCSILASEGILEKKTIYIYKINKSRTFYLAKNFSYTPTLKIYTQPLKYKKNFPILFAEHYSFSLDLLIPNSESGAVFELNNNEILKEMLLLKTNIDFDLLKEMFLEFLKCNELRENELQKEYLSFIQAYKQAISAGNNNLISEIGKKLSIYQKANELLLILKENFPKETNFYLPWKYDFRGRTYFFSEISLTFNKEFRWCMYTGYYKNETDLIPKWHYFNEKQYKILNQMLNEIANLKIDIKNKSIYVKYALINILICLAEVNKIKLGGIVHIREFVKEGIKIFNNPNIENFKYEDRLKIKALCQIIKEFQFDFNKGLHKKRLISKDAPASVFQHLVLNFGWKDKDMLKWCNLNSEDTWYDTYTYFIDNWKKTNIIPKEIADLFNRKSLKRVIMTTNYGVTYNSAVGYFKNEIIVETESNHKITKDTNTWIELQDLFKNFFSFMGAWNNLLKDPKEIEQYVAERGGIITLNDAKVNVNYYKKGNDFVIDFKTGADRYTKTYTNLTEELDYKKFQVAIRANYVQSLDAALVRWAVKKTPIFTVHDCFLIDYANSTYIISIINEGMNEKFHDFHKIWEKEKTTVFSFFIIL